MNRRSFIKRLGLGIASLALPSVLNAKDKKRPNVLFVAIDDLRPELSGPIIVVLPGIISFHIFKGTLTNADQAYPMLVSKVLPASLLGFFAAVLFGAILSSFNSALNSSVTLFGLDIYKSYINKDAS